MSFLANSPITFPAACFLAVAAGYIGTAYLGIHLWLMLNGQMEMLASYPDYKALHASIQVHLFSGVIMSTFLLQLLPALLHLQARHSPGQNQSLADWQPGPAPVIIFLFAGVAAEALGAGYMAKAAIALGYFFLAFQTAPLLKKVSGSEYVQPVFLTIFLATLLVSPFLDMVHPATALFWFWGAPASLLLSTGQNMAFAWAGLKKLSEVQNAILSGMHGLTTVLLYLLSRDPGHSQLPLYCAVLMSVELCFYLALCWKPLKKAAITHFRFRWIFGLSFFWAFAGAILTLCYGGAAVDATFHALALGWLTPLFCFVMVGTVPNMPRWYQPGSSLLTAALCLWQLVPFGRSLGFFLLLPPWFSQVVATAATLFFAPWLLAVSLAVWKNVGLNKVR